MVDSHVHTKKFSCDSLIKIEEYLQKRQEDDLKIVITEHMDLEYMSQGVFVFNPKEYFNHYDKFKKNNILLGIEIGMSETFFSENMEIIRQNPFDFVLASVHFVGEFDVGSNRKFYEKKQKIDAYKEYINETIKLIDIYQSIDALAHFDFVARYSPYEDKELYFDDTKEEISNLFTKMIMRGIVLEFNTKRLTNDISVREYIKFLKLYKELGGMYVTTGSDAHYLDNIAYKFDLAYKILSHLGLKAVYFKNRNMEYI